ncbi:MAG: aldehyde dehydrogenase family protein, partial [Planctomycetales bacterium]|nr:aldehyde dehydrogenase family protein [Planctomycetales bacterium]
MAEPVLINGEWKQANASSTFQSFNPNTTEPLPCEFPVSNWSDCDEALSAAAAAASELRTLSGSQIAAFLRAFADRIEARADQLVEAAHQETALPKSPRLADVELPRTTNQLRLAAQAAEEGSWRQATIDTKAGIRSVYEPIGPVAVFGPNNF